MECTSNTGSVATNRYTWAFQKELGSGGISTGGVVGALDVVLRHSVIHKWTYICDTKGNRLQRVRCYASAKALAHSNVLSTGLASFAARNTPTVGDLIDHTQNRYTGLKGQALLKTLIAPPLTLARTNLEACASVQRDYAATEGSGVYGGILGDKPEDIVRLMYEFFSILGMFALGPSCHKKVRQLNNLIQEYGVDLLAGCETRTDWGFIANEEDRFCNLFGNGQPSRGSSASKTNDRRIKHDQWGGACITAMGQFSSFFTEVGLMTPALGDGHGCMLMWAGRRHELSPPTNHTTPRNGPQWGKWCGTNIPDTLRHGGDKRP
jgi:hypothetical protein